MERYLDYIVRQEDLPADAFTLLSRKLGLTPRQIRNAKYIERGILADGCRIRATRLMQAGERLSVCIESEREMPGGNDQAARRDAPGGNRKVNAPSLEPERVLYEDRDLIVVDKPALMPVHPGRGHYGDTLADALERRYAGTGEAHRIRVVGRLDREASGLVLFAKNRPAAARLSLQDAVEKTYLALAAGYFPQEEGVIRTPICPDPKAKNRMMVCRDEEKGLPCVTRYRVLAQGQGAGLLQVRLETGRTHQIRVHMASCGHPLIGDRFYGSGREEDRETGGAGREGCEPRALLHCAKMVFRLPFEERTVERQSPLPEDMRCLLREHGLPLPAGL